MQVFMRAYSSALAERSLAEARNLTQLTLLKVVRSLFQNYLYLLRALLAWRIGPPNALLTTLPPQ